MRSRVTSSRSNSLTVSSQYINLCASKINTPLYPIDNIDMPQVVCRLCSRNSFQDSLVCLSLDSTAWTQQTFVEGEPFQSKSSEFSLKPDGSGCFQHGRKP